MYDLFEKLLNDNNVTAYRVSKDTGISTATLSDWKKGRSTPKADKLQKIADYFKVSIEYFTGSETKPENKPELNRRDQRDIEKLLNETRDQLLNSEGLMFDGKPATEEEIKQILDAMQIGLEMAKKKNKEKYTPKKYKE
ncbi:helix-turn-helix transcriptional regulator [Eubacteriaceae bacterium ES2]|nr:helix-turn-helix transcriptional regulator [Eubacteriaceae bacterium ES2]